MSTERFRTKILEEADGAARLFLRSAELGQPVTLEQKAVIENIVAADYGGRTVVELLQNAHDAHNPGADDGRITFLLDHGESEHGCLYVGNHGNPLTHANFASLCHLGLSTKRPDEGIGNKGVGFKSVLQLCVSPEVYSASSPEVDRPDGFTFRFARPEDFDAVADRIDPDRPGLSDDLRRNVSGLKVPVPIDVVPDRVNALFAVGYVTVIRLPLRSRDALEEAEAQLSALSQADVPAHLFLDRIRDLTISIIVADGDERSSHLRRHAEDISASIGIQCDRITLQDGSQWLVFHSDLSETAMVGAIHASRAATMLAPTWEGWTGEARVSIAVPAGEPLDEGRFYTFLPMAEDSRAPFPALINAPFATRLDRRTLDESNPLNARLLREVTALCAEVIARFGSGDTDLELEVALDLACWQADRLPDLVQELEERGTPLDRLPLLPPLSPGRRLSIMEALDWPDGGVVLNAKAVAASGEDRFVALDIDPQRARRLQLLATRLGHSLRPTPSQVLDFAESLAGSLTNEPLDGERWAAFYDDLALQVHTGSVAAGRRILIGADGALHRAGEGEGAHVFLPGMTSEDDDRTPESAPPPSVAKRLAFMPSTIRWRGPDQRTREGRRWLVHHDLVQEYRTENVLKLIAASMRAAEADDDVGACLRFAFDVWRARRREVRSDTVADIGLLVPTPSGWIQSREAVFGPGWPGPDASTDGLLVDLLPGAGAISPSLERLGQRTLLPADEVAPPGADLEEWRRFLEVLGVRHGLVPSSLPMPTRSGSEISLGRVPPVQGVPPGARALWSQAARRWPGPGPSFSTREYTARHGVAYLPGQFEFDHLEPADRARFSELVVRGLSEWRDDELEVRWARSTDTGRPTWPSLVAAFLMTAAWSPQTTPNRRSEVSFMSVADAWWTEGDALPFLRSQPPALRALAVKPRARARLDLIGLRFWEAPFTARSRLEELADIVESSPGHRPPRGVMAACATAWDDLVAQHLDPPLKVVVSRAQVPEVVDLEADCEPIYIGTRKTSGHDLLRQTDLPVLTLASEAVATKVLDGLRTVAGGRVRSPSDVDISVLADDVPVEASHAQPLDSLGRWLKQLVVAVLRFSADGPPTPDRQYHDVASRLDRARVTTAREAVHVIGGHRRVRQSDGSSLLVVDDGIETIVVVGVDPSDRWAVIEGASQALGTMLGSRSLPAPLRLAVVDLARRVSAEREPGIPDIAGVLDIADGELLDFLQSIAPWRMDIEATARVVALFDADLALGLRAFAHESPDRDEVRSWLADRLVDRPLALVEDLASMDDAAYAREVLEVDLATANIGLRAVGAPLLHNRVGHAQQVAAFVQDLAASIEDRLRDAFMDSVGDPGARTEYLAAIAGIPAIGPDERWLDDHWVVPQDLMARRVDEWVAEVAPVLDPLPTQLPSVRELRDAARRTIASVMGGASRLVQAWLAANPAESGTPLPSAAEVGAEMLAAGRADFGRITSPDVVLWLHEKGYWPRTMPLTTSRAELGLSDDQIEEARTTLDRLRQEATLDEESIEFVGQTFGANAEGRRDLVEAVRQNLGPQVLDAPDEVSEPLPVADGDGSTVAPRPPGEGSRGPLDRPPTGRQVSHGLIGEVLVGEWILRRHGLRPEDTWVSGYRNAELLDGRGDDGLGYDFEVRLKDRTQFIEVKSTNGDAGQFILGESEVRRAANLSPNEEYRIAFVTNVDDPPRQRLRWLPNPLSPEASRRYRIAGQGLRVTFRLEEVDPDLPPSTVAVPA